MDSRSIVLQRRGAWHTARFSRREACTVDRSHEWLTAETSILSASRRGSFRASLKVAGGMGQGGVGRSALSAKERNDIQYGGVRRPRFIQIFATRRSFSSEPSTSPFSHLPLFHSLIPEPLISSASFSPALERGEKVCRTNTKDLFTYGGREKGWTCHGKARGESAAADKGGYKGDKDCLFGPADGQPPWDTHFYSSLSTFSFFFFFFLATASETSIFSVVDLPPSFFASNFERRFSNSFLFPGFFYTFFPSAFFCGIRSVGRVLGL